MRLLHLFFFITFFSFSQTNEVLINQALQTAESQDIQTKSQAVKALQGLNFKVIAAGDSYNDIGMLQQADRGILFCPPESVIKEFPQYPIANNYKGFQDLLISARQKLSG